MCSACGLAAAAVLGVGPVGAWGSPICGSDSRAVQVGLQVQLCCNFGKVRR